MTDKCDSCDAAKSPQGNYAVEVGNYGLTVTKLEVAEGVGTASIIRLEPYPEGSMLGS